MEEELVFDNGVSDYDDVRYCCSGANIFKKCWPLMAIAVKVIDSALRGRSSYISYSIIYISRGWMWGSLMLAMNHVYCCIENVEIFSCWIVLAGVN